MRDGSGREDVNNRGVAYLAVLCVCAGAVVFVLLESWLNPCISTRIDSLFKVAAAIAAALYFAYQIFSGHLMATASLSLDFRRIHDGGEKDTILANITIERNDTSTIRLEDGVVFTSDQDEFETNRQKSDRTGNNLITEGVHPRVLYRILPNPREETGRRRKPDKTLEFLFPSWSGGNLSLGPKEKVTFPAVLKDIPHGQPVIIFVRFTFRQWTSLGFGEPSVLFSGKVVSQVPTPTFFVPISKTL